MGGMGGGGAQFTRHGDVSLGYYYIIIFFFLKTVSCLFWGFGDHTP